MGKVHLLSLGCPKNLVDSENLLKKLRAKGIHYSSSPDDADVIMINTCGFIEEAKKESIEEILRAVELKGKNKRKKLVVYGCLAKRSGEELMKEIPGIDAIWGVGEDDEIAAYCKRIIPASIVSKRGAGKTIRVIDEKLTDNPYAYLKISEGCDRKCSYCVIPKIRGGYKSRDPLHIFREAESLVGSGIKELILVAQDITAYGKDMKGYGLGRLISDIASIKGDFWVRLLYLYPTSIDTKLIETIGKEEKVCNYIDMPLQHSEEKILKLMGRGGGSRYFEKLISRIRGIIPDVNIRTTFITGFPQETHDDFKGMMEFIKKIRFDRLGVFTYSREEDTGAFGLKGQVPRRTMERRYEKIMELQSEISLEKNVKLVGRTFKALVDEVENDIAVARIYSQTPDIDGVVVVRSGNIKKGDFVDVRIIKAYDYDLEGAVVE